MNALDASVLIAAFATWHESHGAAFRVVSARPALVAHAALEAYSVMTRLPDSSRAPAGLVLEFLERNFQPAWLTLTPAAHRELMRTLAVRGVIGGAVYDALIAETARAHGARLLSLDRRACETYDRVGVSYQLLG